MATVSQGYEKLKYMMEHGRAEEKIHIVFVEQEQADRIKNDKRKTRFVLCCDDPDLCANLEAQKDRIFRKVKNKAVMLTLIERVLEEALSDAELDRILAIVDAPEVMDMQR
jgi:hypothetical protein